MCIVLKKVLKGEIKNMNLLKKIFGSNSKLPKKKSENREVLVNISSVVKNKIPSNTKIIAESQIPKYCSIGNLIFEKKYHEAIELGKELLKKTPHSAGVHVNLMDAYFKIRNENPVLYDKSIRHARLAMLYGHNTGYVQKKLAVGLEKQGKIHQALQICNIVLSDKFHFSRHGCGDIDEFAKRKERLIKKVNKSIDNEKSKNFTDEEISFIIKQIHMEEERIKQEEIEHEKRMKLLRRKIGI